MKKKLLVCLLASMFVLMFSACGAEKDDDADSKKKDEIVEDIESEEDEEDVVESTEDEEDVVESTEDVEDVVESTEDVEATDVEETDDATNELAGEFAFDVPEGFVDESGSGMYQNTNAESFANIYIYSIPNDGSFDTVTKDALLTILEPELESTFGQELEIAMPLFEEIDIDGRRTIRFAIEYEYAGMKIVQKQYIMENGETIQYVSYTYSAGEECEAALIASEDTIRFE